MGNWNLLDANGYWAGPGSSSSWGSNSWYSPPAQNYSQGMMNPASNTFMQPGGVPVQQGNWWTESVDWFKDTEFGQGIDSMGQSMGGWGNALNGLNALMGMWSGFKAMGEREDYLKMAKREARDKRKLVDNFQRDQWIARNANAQSSGREMQSEADWMKQRAIGA